ncbi:MAG: hypothetical protein JWO25_2799 [Alphaproteobacteria bacterium]|nr:hypothetical protein [Alphaproteobacteria bacterium]MDB5722127.1 hypothetical protein [Alphaproteobacteria bacterium]
MKSLILAAAAALSLGAIGAAPAMAQPDRHDNMGDRHDMGMQGDRHDGNMGDRHDGDRHDNNWRDGDRGRHNGWRNHRRQHCWMVWRHHHRERVCSWR